jgi:uncharacterized repeat protein (TIGR02543 family)
MLFGISLYGTCTESGGVWFSDTSQMPGPYMTEEACLAEEGGGGGGDNFPTSADKNITTSISTGDNYTFSMNDFAYSDLDNDPLSVITISTTYLADDTHGSFDGDIYIDANSNGIIDSGENIPVAYLSNNVLSAVQDGKLKFKPSAGGIHYIYFAVGNSKAYAANTNNLKFTVTQTVKYTLTFEENGGSTVTDQSINENSTATEPTSPTKSGYTFGGWYTDVGLTNAYNFSTQLSANTTLYAKWTIINNAPTNLTLSASTIAENSAQNTKVGDFSTTDDGTIFTYSFCNGVNDGNFTISGNSLLVKNNLDYEAATTQTICVKTTDSGSLSFSKNFTINVTNVNEAPVITSTAITSNTINTLYSYTPTATDPEDDNITWSVGTGTTLPTWLSFDNGVKVNPNFTITNTYNITNYLVDISENYTTGDVLTFDSSKLPSGVTGSFDATKGLLKFTGSATPASWQELLRTVKMTFSNTSTLARKVSFTEGSNVGLKINGVMHYYEVVNESKSWTSAKSAAEAKTFNGLKGYLVTITSQVENDFIVQKVNSNSWIGASDAQTEREWKWVTGPESGTYFFNQISQGGGNAINGLYSNWSSGEPNQYLGANEDYGHIYASNKKWNDFPEYYAISYIVEYGGMGNDASTSDITKNFTVTPMPLRLYGTPTANGIYDVTLVATDALGHTTEQPFTITVSNSNLAPIVTSTAITTATEKTLYEYVLEASDDNGDTLTWSSSTLPSWLTLSSLNGITKLKGTPTSSNVGANSVSLSVSDGKLSATHNFSITVEGVPAIQITSTPTENATLTSSYIYYPTAKSSTGKPIAWSVKNGTNLPAGITLEVANSIETIASGLSYPAGIITDMNGNVYVADRTAYSVKKIDTNGTLTTLIGRNSTNEMPEDITIDKDGYLYVAYYAKDYVKKFNTTGTLIETINSKAGYYNSEIEVDSLGNIYLLSYKYNSNLIDTEYISQKISNGISTTLTTDSGLNRYDAFAIDNTDTLYIQDSISNLSKITSNGTESSLETSIHAYDLAVNNGYYYYISNHKLYKMSIDSGNSTVLVGSGLGYYPKDIEIADDNSTIYIADTSNKAVKKYYQTSRLSGTPTSSGTYSITLVATDGAGNSLEQTFTLVVDATENSANQTISSGESTITSDNIPISVSTIGNTKKAIAMIEGSDGLPVQTTVTQTTGGYNLASMLVGGNTSTVESTNSANVNLTPTGVTFTTQNGFATIQNNGSVIGNIGNNSIIIPTGSAFITSTLISTIIQSFSCQISDSSATLGTITATGGAITIDGTNSNAPLLNVIGISRIQF